MGEELVQNMLDTKNPETNLKYSEHVKGIEE